MRSIFQTNEYGCGIASFSMLCGLSHSEGKRRCRDIYVKGYGIEEKALLRLLSKTGLKMVSKGKLGEGRLVTGLNYNALLYGFVLPVEGAIRRKADGFGKANCFEHWAVWDAEQKVIRDPYRYARPFQPTYYYEFRPK